MSEFDLKELSQRYKNDRAEDLPELTEDEYYQVLDGMLNPEVRERVFKLMEQDDGTRRVKASGMW